MQLRAASLSQSLGYAGLIPFYGALVMLASTEDYPHAFATQGFVIYSLGILCFMAGTLWGQSQAVATSSDSTDANSSVTNQKLQLLVSNGLAVFAVISVLTAQALIASILLLLGYLATLWYERSIGVRDAWYLQMRTRLTALVGLAHLLFAAIMVVQN